PVVGGACTFGRNHGDAEGMLGRTARAKGRTFGRLAFAAEDQAADALALFLLLRHHYPEPRLGVEVVVGLRHGEAALLDLADAPPAAVHDAEDVAHDPLRRLIALPADGARILVLHF